MKNFIFTIIFLIFSLFAAVFLAELVHSYYWGHQGHEFKAFVTNLSGEKYTVEHKNLGIIGGGDSVVKHVRTKGNRIIAETTISTEGAFRKVPQFPGSPKGKNILFYGGSYIYGLGVNDDETLPAYVQDTLKMTNVFNIAWGGWGVQQLLWLIENQWFEKLNLNQNGGWLIYGMNPDHVDRFLNHPRVSTYVPFNFETAYYKNIDGRLIHQGTFSENFPIQKKVISLLNQTSIGQHLLFGSTFKYSWEKRSNFCLLLKQSAQLLKQKYNLNFAVFYYPNKTISEDMNQCLKESLVVLDYRNELSDLKAKKQLGVAPGDSHPSKYQNKNLSDLIIKDLKLLEL